ncbi:TetR/AcrR family transcriptional regulator [Paraburkholderia tagetis]|uniref:TetR/AcrR family transcriptional regulator n=1 Tax=Paraburkholderia tagetis TaxID=2913261 RepID=A0A9X1RM31_9BURK|nr:TetR/AcrR family transcriptional regulator [Paraburkholderia tagetis]MCG5073590.1 TetR/AcrR family transcriptional regulator [Paraburkholderia tagetis]
MTSAQTASPWPKQSERQKQREMKREAVLRTAAQLFNEKGFHAASLDEVAERLHVTKPTLYYYAKNKDEILFECVRTGLDMMQNAIRAVSESGGTAVEKLQAAMFEYAMIVTMDFGMCVVRVGEDSLTPDNRKALRHLKAGIDREFRTLIEQAIDEGTFAPCNPKIAAFAVAGGLSWIARWYRPDGPLSPEEVAQQTVATLLAGLYARPEQSDGGQRDGATATRAHQKNRSRRGG